MKYENDEVKKLANVLDVIARKCWRGLPALMGLEPQPTREQLKQALFFRPSPDEDLGTKVQGGGSLEGREITQEDVMIDEVRGLVFSVEEHSGHYVIVQTEKGSDKSHYAKDFPQTHKIFPSAMDAAKALMAEAERQKWRRAGV